VIVDDLQGAEVAIDKNDLRAALHALLEAWRDARIPKLADVIERVAEELARTLPPIKARALPDRIAAWSIAMIGNEQPPKKLDQATFLVEAYLRWPDDPRIATAIIAYVESPGVMTDAGLALVDRLLARLAEIGDVRGLPRLQAHLASKRSPERHPRLLETIAALELVTPPSLEPEAEELLARIAQVFAPRTGTASAEDLLAAIYAAPADRATVAVFGDWLAAQGDPRGEFIALQLQRDAGALDAKAEAREKKLLAEHGAKWAGALAKWFRSEDRRFERGFFAGGRLRDGYPDDMLADPAWSMVRVLELGPSLERLAGQLVDRPELRSLRALGVVTEPFAEQLAAGDPASTIEELHWIPRDDADRTTGPLATFAGLPSIRVLAPWGSADQLLSWCTVAPVIERLQRVILGVEANTSRLVNALAARAGVREVELGHGRFGKQVGWTIVASRTTDGTPFSSIHCAWRGAKGELAHLAHTFVMSMAAFPSASSVTFDVRAKLDLPDVERAQLDAALDRLVPGAARPWR